MRIFKTKAFFLFFIATLFVGALAWYLGGSVYKSQADAPKVNVSVVACSTNLKPSETQSINFILDPEGDTNKVSGFDVTFKATGNVELISTGQPVTLADSEDFGQKVTESLSATSVRVMYAHVGAEAGAVKIPLNFKGTGDGSGTISVESTSAQVTGNITEVVYAVGTTQQADLTFSSGGTVCAVEGMGGVGNVKLNLQLKFHGISGKPAGTDKMKVRVKVAKGSAQSVLSAPVEFTANDQGIFSGSVSVAAAAGDGYQVLVKGGKHIQKKVCDVAPSESAAGTYRCSSGNITLQNGDNNLNFSGISLLVGDLPLTGGDPSSQNGLVDSQDISYVRQNLGKRDAGILAIGDLNNDGVVDSQDASLIIQALNVKYDEE